jgi:hypothetical protein
VVSLITPHIQIISTAMAELMPSKRSNYSEINDVLNNKKFFDKKAAFVSQLCLTSTTNDEYTREIQG